MKWLRIDSPLFQWLISITDIVLLNLYFLMTTVFTLGIGLCAGISALIYAIYHGIRREEGHLRHAYIKSFKNNFKQLSPYSLFVTVLILLIHWIPNQLPMMSQRFYQGLQYFITAELALQALYVCVQQAKISMTLTDSLKNSFLLIHRHPLTSLVVLLSLVIGFASIIIFRGLTVFFLFALEAFIIEYLVLEKLLIDRYMPEEMAKKLRISSTE